MIRKYDLIGLALLSYGVIISGGTCYSKYRREPSGEWVFCEGCYWRKEPEWTFQKKQFRHIAQNSNRLNRQRRAQINMRMQQSQRK